MKRFIAHMFGLGVSFFAVFMVLLMLLAIVVVLFSFLFWTIPPIPTPDTLFFALRTLLAISMIITIVYAFSNDYKEAVQEFLSR